MIVDANKLIAAFLKNGLIRRIVVLGGIRLFTIELVKAGIDERVYNLIHYVNPINP